MADEVVVPAAPEAPPFDGAAIALVYAGQGVGELPARDLTAHEVQVWGAAFEWAAYLTNGCYTPGPAWPVPPAADPAPKEST
jgi:hypothetical protein